jgi:hypothetical protein
VKKAIALPWLAICFMVAWAAVPGYGTLLAEQARPEKMQHGFQIRVTIDQAEIPQGATPESVLRKKAEKKGIKRVNKHWLNRRLLFQPTNHEYYPLGQERFVFHRGDFEARRNEVTKVYTQAFRVKANFVPVRQVSGTIVELQDKRSLAAQNDFVTLKLHGLVPGEGGAYCIVSRPKTVQDEQYQHMIGAARIYHTANRNAQAVLLRTNKEIMVDDSVYMMQIEVEPVASTAGAQKREPKPEATETSETEEVMVKPEKEPEKEPVGPKVTK